MSTKKKTLAAVIAATLSAGMITSGISTVFASEDGSANAAQEQAIKADKDLIKVSRDAFLSMRNLHNARLAIFNGQPGQATTFVDAAVTRIGAAADEAQKYAVDIKAPKDEDLYVPFEGNYTVLDSLKPVENAKAEPDGKKTENVAKAENHAKPEPMAKADEPQKQDDSASAAEQLKLSEVDIAVSTGLIPVNFAKAHIERASKLVGEGKFYEANLELKAVEDAMLVQTVTLDETPKAKDATANAAHGDEANSDAAASS